MSGRLWWIVALVVLAGIAWGCGRDPFCADCGDPGPAPSQYVPQTSPENVLHNWQVSFERREIEEYAKLLDPEYFFELQQADIPPGLERDYWNRDEDSTLAAALFNNPDVVRIRLDLGAFEVEDAGRPDAPGVQWIRLTHATLEVELLDGTTLTAQGEIQDMYFRRGSVAAGTDSTKWYLFEWQDQGGDWASVMRGER